MPVKCATVHWALFAVRKTSSSAHSWENPLLPMLSRSLSLFTTEALSEPDDVLNMAHFILFSVRWRSSTADLKYRCRADPVLTRHRRVASARLSSFTTQGWCGDSKCFPWHPQLVAQEDSIVVRRMLSFLFPFWTHNYGSIKREYWSLRLTCK